jgi:hypothetical protein
MSDYLNTTHHTVAWLRKAETERTLDVAPPFERNPVWTTPQKAFLIDTLLRLIRSLRSTCRTQSINMA